MKHEVELSEKGEQQLSQILDRFDELIADLGDIIDRNAEMIGRGSRS